jgi:uncharacterized delta-60 repeat protein
VFERPIVGQLVKPGGDLVKAGRFICALLLGAIWLGMATAASAAPGDVDRAFGQEGTAMLPSEDGSFITGNDMAVGPDNEIYVLSTAFRCGLLSSCMQESLVSRLRPGGALDTAFGQGGRAAVIPIPLEYGGSGQGALAVGRDGKAVVAALKGRELLLARLDSSGRPDLSFGAGGVATDRLGIEPDRMRIAAGADGSIVVAAEAGFGAGNQVVAVARYTSQGVPDPAFNGGSPLMTSLGSGLGGLGLESDGTAIVAGPRCCQQGSSVHLVGITSKGVFDPDFGPRGQRFVDDVAPEAAVGSVSILNDGRIVVVGAGKNGRPFALRLLPDGRLDRRFGNRGIAHARAAFSGEVRGVLDGSDRLLIAGTALREPGRPGNFRRLAVLRRLRNGGPDGTFGGGNAVAFPFLEGAGVLAIDIQSGDRIVVLSGVGECSRTCPSPIRTVVRYLGGDSGARCHGKKATIVGTRNSERLMGTSHRDVIAAGAGNDVVLGRGGNDLICGGPGNDRLVGGGGRDRLLGGAGRNHLEQ